MITYIQAIILGAIQGITELFPVSSLGHSVIIPSLFGWQIDQGAGYFIVFLVAVHLATALVLIGFFFKDWVLIVKGIVRSVIHTKIETGDVYAKLGWLLIIGTVPAGLLGFSFQNKIAALLASPKLVAFILILNGCMLFIAEMLRKASADRRQHAENANASDAAVAKLSLWQSAKVGVAQALALFPGFSRTGAALGGGLLVGLDHENAARFAFLLATPIILAAGVLKLPLLFTHASSYPIGQIIAGAIAAAVGAFFSTRYLLKYFQTRTLRPFATYCVCVGVLSLVILLVR